MFGVRGTQPSKNFLVGDGKGASLAQYKHFAELGGLQKRSPRSHDSPRRMEN